MSDREKQIYRRLKRVIKRDGTRERRRVLKAQLASHPDDCTADDDELDYGQKSTKGMNGVFHDAKRLDHKDLEGPTGARE